MSSLNHLHRNNKKSKSNKNGNGGNLKTVGICLSLLGILIIIQALRWQVIESDKFTLLAQEQYTGNPRQSTSRGVISAIDGTILAVDEPVWGIYATLSKDEDERELFFSGKEKFVAEVSGILGLEKGDIETKITQDFVYFPIAHGVEAEKKQALAEANIFGEGTEGFGLYFEREEKRIYPNGELASHVLGFMGKNEDGEDVGQYGIEGFYFGDIVGEEGYTYEEKDSSGNVILTGEYEPILPRQGKDFTLTVIPLIQQKVEEILKEGVEYHQAKSGTAIIMNPQTGAIIAMANYPTYNPNEYWLVSEPWVLKNRAVADVYEYGSVHKPITVAIALETESIDDDYMCNDNTGYLDLYKATGYEDQVGKKIYTWNKLPAGNLDLKNMLKTSNNPCLAKVALETGHQLYYPKLKEFGIGEFIGIGLQDEATSYIKPYEEWTKLDLITTAYGQSISATPLQVVSALSTIANDGQRMRPYIISEISDDDETIKFEPQVISEPISAEVAQKVAQMMVHVSREGDPKYFFAELNKKYNIAGKTGSAQIAKTDGPGYEEEKTNTTFVGFAPAEDAQMIMIVRMEEPKSSPYAALTAVPVWKDIFEAIADDLEIPQKD
jgi:cell division protein FtsI/penicillin-binding protein 2